MKIKTKYFTIILLILSFYDALGQCKAYFSYQYHNDAAKGGTFKLACDSFKIDKPASSGFLQTSNNPYFQLMKNWGPLPNGTWEIYEVKSDSAAILRIRPTENVLMPKDSKGMPYRDGFLIHGVNTGQTPDDASHGCIILDRTSRNILLKAFKKHGIILLEVKNMVTGDYPH